MQNKIEPHPFTVYIQQLMSPLSKRFIYASYANSLPVKSDDKVIEFGSGVGVMANMLAHQLNEGNLTCIDISNRYLNVVKKRLRNYKNVEFRSGSINAIDLPCDSFNIVNIHFVLHDIPADERQMVVSKLFELLIAGGKVFIREPMNPIHGISSKETKHLFMQAGFIPLYEQEEQLRFLGNVFTACYSKLSTMKFFFS